MTLIEFWDILQADLGGGTIERFNITEVFLRDWGIGHHAESQRLNSCQCAIS